MKKILLCFVLFLGIVFKGQSQRVDTPPNAQPGKCYGKCFLKADGSPINPEWEEVLCSQYITSNVIREINLALQGKGYDVDVNEKTLSQKSKDAMNKFQKTFNLPIGNLNIKTLDALGVRY